MKNATHALLSTGSALLLALSLAACGGSASSQQSSGGQASTTQAKTSSTDASVDPALINPGWLPDQEDYVAGTSDLWYPIGSNGKGERLYFTNAANDAGIDVTFVDAEEHEDNVWDLEVSSGHLKTLSSASDKRKVDITFQDDFSCYDAVADIHYERASSSADDYVKLFCEHPFVEDADSPDKYKVTFSTDGSVTIKNGEDEYSGTWKVAAVNVAEVHFKTDGSEWDDEYRVLVDKDGKPTELDEGSFSNLVVYNK